MPDSCLRKPHHKSRSKDSLKKNLNNDQTLSHLSVAHVVNRLLRENWKLIQKNV